MPEVEAELRVCGRYGAGVTMPDLTPWLIGLVLVALVGFLYWAERRYPAPSKPRERPVLLTYCAWCVHRAGDECTHPRSPVSGQECGPVCIGQVRCEVREVKRGEARLGVVRQDWRGSLSAQGEA